ERRENLPWRTASQRDTKGDDPETENDAGSSDTGSDYGQDDDNRTRQTKPQRSGPDHTLLPRWANCIVGNASHQAVITTKFERGKPVRLARSLSRKSLNNVCPCQSGFEISILNVMRDAPTGRCVEISR